MTKKIESQTPEGYKSEYGQLLNQTVDLINQARHLSARAINAFLTVAYWEVGRLIVEFEQGGKKKAEYGEALLEKLATDLTSTLGRGFAKSNLYQMRRFYCAYPDIFQTISGKSEKSLSLPSVKEISKVIKKEPVENYLAQIIAAFPLSWSVYVRLLSIKNKQSRSFYEAEALRGGWTVKQLNRQISTQFYERTALSRNKAAMLAKGAEAQQVDTITPEEEIKDPFILEFLKLKDEYSEYELEEALIRHLETFLLELGSDFTFVARQKRLRIGDEWYRIDLLFFHRRLHCLVVVDLKLSKFTHADAGQMHMYLNYVKEHWTHQDENPPVGLILCAEKNDALAKYALEGLPNKILTTKYQITLPDEKRLEQELIHTRKILEQRKRDIKGK